METYLTKRVLIALNQDDYDVISKLSLKFACSKASIGRMMIKEYIKTKLKTQLKDKDSNYDGRTLTI